MARLLYFSSIALVVSGFAGAPAVAAGPPTAVSNLPVVTADRVKAKQAKKPDPKAAAERKEARAKKPEIKR